MKNKKKLKKTNTMRGKDIVMGIVLALFTFLCMYFGMPTFSYGFAGWSFMILFIGIIIFLFDLSDGEIGGSWRLGLGVTFIVIGVIFSIILPIGTMPMFRADDYRNLIGTVTEKTFSSDISPTNPSDIIIIDYEVAENLADKKLVDQNSALGSQVEIGKFTLQKVKDKMYYVAPLNHTDYWKYRSNKQGTPGYMIVNANNDRDVQLITKVNGVDIRLKYQDGAFWGDYLPRYLYQHGYKTIGLTDYSFEIDDDMMPWYVVTMYDKKVGYLGNDATGVVLVNPINGDIKQYSIKDAPAWVDRIQPKEFMIEQVNDWGILVHGAWNWKDLDKRQLSVGTQLVYGEDGVCYLYSGVTSVGKDNASMGFVLINSRTKETIFYKSSGSVETAIQGSAEQKVSEKGYYASFPRPYNINGVWTYVMALKDKNGLIKSIALVSYENYQVVGVGDNIMDALRNYKSALNSTGNVIAPSSENTYKEIKGIITRINSVYNNNNNYFYFTIKETPNKLFVTTSNISNEILLTQLGDIIVMKVLNTDEGEIFVDNFDNINLNFDKTKEQIGIERIDSTNKARLNSEQIDTRFKAVEEKLTDAQKLKLIEDSKKK